MKFFLVLFSQKIKSNKMKINNINNDEENNHENGVNYKLEDL